MTCGEKIPASPNLCDRYLCSVNSDAQAETAILAALIVSPPHILRLFRIHRDRHRWYSGAIFIHFAVFLAVERRGVSMSKFIAAGLLAVLLSGCATESPCVPVYDDQGRLVHTNTCMKGTTQDNWETAGAIAGGAAAVAGLTLGIIALTK